MPLSPTVYIVHDGPAASESVAAIVASHGVSSKTFESAEQFLSCAGGEGPGCLVVDVGRPGLTGIELHQRLLQQGNRMPVIVITAYADVPMAVSALKQGVFMLLQKPCADEDLWKSISEALDFDAEQRQRRAEEQAVLDRYRALSDDERRVLKLIVAGHANKAIASKLSIGLRTVELRRAAILRKMQADSVAELVRMTIGLPPP